MWRTWRTWRAFKGESGKDDFPKLSNLYSDAFENFLEHSHVQNLSSFNNQVTSSLNGLQNLVKTYNQKKQQDVAYNLSLMIFLYILI